MRRWSLLGALVLSLALAAPAGATPGSTYHGTLDGAAFSCHGAPVTAGVAAVSGVWNVSVAGSKAVVTLNVSYDGDHHLSFGTSAGSVLGTDPLTISVWDGVAVATVDGDSFTWAFPDLGYACPGEAPYDSLVYRGTVGR